MVRDLQKVMNVGQKHRYYHLNMPQREVFMFLQGRFYSQTLWVAVFQTKWHLIHILSSNIISQHWRLHFQPQLSRSPFTDQLSQFIECLSFRGLWTHYPLSMIVLLLQSFIYMSQRPQRRVVKIANPGTDLTQFKYWTPHVWLYHHE